jgi:hypothetical protein
VFFAPPITGVAALSLAEYFAEFTARRAIICEKERSS